MIELAEQRQILDLLLVRQFASGFDERERILRIDIQPHAAIFGAEVSRAVGPCAATAVAGGRTEHNVFGQIFVDGAQAVGGPGADGGEGSFARMAAGLPGELRAVVVVNRP